MKRLSSSDSLIPICPSAPPEKGMYRRGFPSVLDGMDDDECGEEELCSSSQAGEKKRRLSTDQVRALEKNFEVENKLDPERKVRLAQELGLQPRQVAVWFQNRRARWKTKQLERDFTALKASYDALRVDYDALHHDKQALLAEIKELKAKRGDEESFSSVKEVQEEDNPVASESDIKASEVEEPPALIYKDGSSDSDSSAVLNDDTSPYHMVSSSTTSAVLPATSMPFNSNPSCSPFMNSDSRTHKAGLGFGLGFSFQHQLLKAEEPGFEDPCSNFFADDQAPTLSWYGPDQWNWMD